MTLAREPLPGFGDLGGRVWLNTAHQGALPLSAADEACEAVRWKTAPHELTQDRFGSVPARLRTAVARLIGASEDDVVLANSASHGLHLIAAGYPWRKGDEILVMDGDFPSDILPWLLLERMRGVRVVRVRPRGPVVEPDELAAAIGPRTRLFCVTWVHSFSGFAVDLPALSRICRDHGVVSVINASQAVGVRPLDVTSMPVDAVTSVGFKWLCGPYGTGFAWLSPTLRRRLAPTKAYWLSMMTADDLSGSVDLAGLPQEEEAPASRHDIFGTANFLNFKPFAAAVEHLVGLGTGRVRDHAQALVSRLVDGIDPARYDMISPAEPTGQRSTLVFLRPRREDVGAVHRRLRETGIDVAARAGALRLAPHLYNTAADIDRSLEALHEAARGGTRR